MSKAFVVPAMTALAVLLNLLGSSPVMAADQPPKLLVVVTSAEPQVQGMAMVLSKQSHAAGAEVQILLCGPGGDLALKGAPQTRLKPRNVTPQELLVGLMVAGVTADVCALYLPNSGKTADDLIQGVGLAKPPAIAAVMLAPSTRLFTF